MTATVTSRNRYREMENSDELNGQQEKVWNAIQDMKIKPFTRNELREAQLPDWQKSTISGRINELLEKGFLKKFPKRKDLYADHNTKVETLMPVINE